MLRITCFGMMLGLLFPLFSSTANADVVSDTLSAANTFQSGTVTGGTETIFQIASSDVIDPGVELNQFATLYDIDFFDGGLTMTLANNTGLSTTLFEAGVFDRYYYGFDAHTVDSVSSIIGDTELTNGLTANLLAPGFELAPADLFSTGISLPQTFTNGGLVLEFGEGTNLGTVGRSVTLNFTTTAVPEPTSAVLLCGLSGLVILRRRRPKSSC